MRAAVICAVLAISRATAIAGDDDPVPALVVRLDSTKADERVRATRALGRIDDARALDALRRAQADASPDVQREAASALAKAGKADETTVAILTRSLGTGDWYTRWQACLGLKAIGKLAEPAVPALVKALGDGTGDVSREAALTLATVAPADKRTIAAFSWALAKGKGDRRPLFHAIAMCGDAAVDLVPLLINEYQDPDSRYRKEAFEAMESLAAISVLTCAKLLDFGDWNLRVCAVRGLRGARIEDAMPFFRLAAKDRSLGVRLEVARVAEAMRREGWLLTPLLVPMLAEPSEEARKAAGRAVAAVGALALAKLVQWRPSVAPYLAWSDLGEPEYTALESILGDAEIGVAVGRTLAEIRFGASGQVTLERSMERDTGPERRAAIMLLPYVAVAPGIAASALERVARDPEVKDIAERALAELSERK